MFRIFCAKRQHARFVRKTNTESLHRRSILVCMRLHVGVDRRCLRTDAQRRPRRERRVFSTGNLLDGLCEAGSCEKTLDKGGWAGFTRGCIQGRLLGRDANRNASCRVPTPHSHTRYELISFCN